MDDTSADESSEKEVPLPRRSARCKRPTPVCHLCNHELGCSEIEKQDQWRAVKNFNVLG